MAEHDGEMLAAIAASSGAVITDPGRPVADVVRGLRRRRYQLLRLERRRRRRTNSAAPHLAAPPVAV